MSITKFVVYNAMAFSFYVTLSLQVNAQKYTTILPDIAVNTRTQGDGRADVNLEIKADYNGKESVRSLFKFKLGMLPVNALVNSLQLRLYVQKKSDTLSSSHQTVTILQSLSSDWKMSDAGWNNPVFDTTKKIGMFPIISTTSILNIKLAIPRQAYPATNFLKTADTSLSLVARSPQQSQDNFFYSDRPESIGTQYSKKPKLLVQYAVNLYPKLSDWSQLRNDGQHSGYTDWMTNTFATAATLVPLYQPDKGFISGSDPLGAMLIYNGNPVIFTRDSTNKEPVHAIQLDAAGKILWSVPMAEINKFCPLIDEKGRMYCITTNRLIVLDLSNSGNKLLDVTLTSLLGNDVGSVVNTPTLGYDGMLYLPSSNAVVALTPFPDFKTLWRYPVNRDNEWVGPVSLSNSERNAFFIKVNNSYGQLIVLDNSDGTPLDSSSQNHLRTYVYDQYTHYIPAPVVANDSSVFVLNGFDNSNELFCFRWSYNKHRLSLLDNITSNQALNTGISQPAVDMRGNAWFVLNNHMARYSLVDKSCIYSASGQSLDNASLLVINDMLQVFALDAINNLVAGFNTRDKLIKETFVSTPGTQFNFKKNLVLAPNGTLYNVNNNYLIAIKAAKVDVEVLNLSAVKNNTLYRANTLINMSGTVINTTNAIIYSGGGIAFKNGFKVEPGAKLSFQSRF